MVPPGTQIGPIEPAARQALIRASVVYGTYEKEIDRESAYEILQRRATQAVEAAEAEVPAPSERGTARRGPSPLEAFATSALRSLGTQVGRQMVRGVLGSLFGGRR